MISLEHLLLDQGVLDAKFSCDIALCKGACCTMPGGAGAPVRDEEVDLVRGAVKATLPYLDESSRRVIEDRGPVEKIDGKWATTCIDDKDCVFVRYEGDIATCTIEKAWHNKEVDFRKPLSCHLFPIRIADFGGPYVHYEEFDECEGGRNKGKADGVLLVDAVGAALDRAFGNGIAQKIRQAAYDVEKGGIEK